MNIKPNHTEIKDKISLGFKYCTLSNKMFTLTLSQEIFHVSRATVPVLADKLFDKR